MSFLCWCGRKEARRECSESQTYTEMEHIKTENIQHPTLNEVIAWSRSFKMMMRSQEGRDIFLEFLRSEHSEENLMFCIACEDLKKETNPSVIAAKSRIIYQTYISIFSPKMINLDFRVRDDIIRSLATPSITMFEEARLQIYNLMRRNFFPKFLNSSAYRDLLNSKKHNVSAIK